MFAASTNEHENIGDEINKYKSKLFRLTGTKQKKRLKKLIRQITVQPTGISIPKKEQVESVESMNIDTERVNKKQKIK